MANLHSKVLPSRKRRPPAASYCQYFQDATASTTGAVPPPWPLSAVDFMDVQLRELAQLNDRLNLLSQQLNPLIEACITGRMPVDMFTAVCLLRLPSDVCELTGHAEPVTASNHRRWIQVNARRQLEER